MEAWGAVPHACNSDFFMLMTRPYGTASAIITLSALVRAGKFLQWIARSSAKACKEAESSMLMARDILCSRGSMYRAKSPGLRGHPCLSPLY